MPLRPLQGGRRLLIPYQSRHRSAASLHHGWLSRLKSHPHRPAGAASTLIVDGSYNCGQQVVEVDGLAHPTILAHGTPHAPTSTQHLASRGSHPPPAARGYLEPMIAPHNPTSGMLAPSKTPRLIAESVQANLIEKRVVQPPALPASTHFYATPCASE